MKPVRTAIALAFLMAVSAIAGIASRPTGKVGDQGQRYVLEEVVPKQFGDWREQALTVTQLVNPQAKELLDKLYTQVLTRTYADSSGYRIMLSLAYGDDQRGDLQAHEPRNCYPAQGFAVEADTEAEIDTPFGQIAARRLRTSLGQRLEPVSYWLVIGDTTVRGHLQKRLAAIRLGLKGQVADGLLFRVSSLDDTPSHAFERHNAFVVDLMQAIAPRDRARLAGLRAPG